jgi:hypothetical protein
MRNNTTPLCSRCFQKARRGMSHCSNCGFDRKVYPIIEVDNKIAYILSAFHRKGYTTMRYFSASFIDNDSEYEAPSVTIRTDTSQMWKLYSNEILGIMIATLPRILTMNIENNYKINGSGTPKSAYASSCDCKIVTISGTKSYDPNKNVTFRRMTLEIFKDWVDGLPDLKKVEKEEFRKDILDMWLMPHYLEKKNYM